MDAGPHTLQEDLTLQLSADGKYLQAQFPAALQREAISYEWLQTKLSEFGLDCLSLNNDAIAMLIQQYNEGTNNATLNIGERLDGEFRIRISDDVMTAYLDLNRAYGGTSVSKEIIDTEIQKLGITHGILSDAIIQAIDVQEAQNLVIAQSDPVLPGNDGYFENLIPNAKDRTPRIDDKGIAHYHDMGQLITVNPGDPIIRRMPPTDGQAGTNIKGETIIAKQGEHIMYAPNLPGTKYDPNDKNVLLADIYGQPVVVENGAIVEPTLTVDNVDLSTGNIVFEGTVLIKGNVTTGLQVKSSGDIIIEGMVEEAAYIEAGGDIIVSQGVIGRGSITENNGQPGKGIVKLRSQGSISAKFIENAQVFAAKHIEVSELIVHSDICARQNVVVGKKSAKRGHIMGGTTRAGMMLQAEVLGSQGSTLTKIDVGSAKPLQKKLANITQLIETKTNERFNLEKVYNQASKARKLINQGEKSTVLQKLQTTLDRLQLESNHLIRLKTEYEQRIGLLRNAKTQVKKNLYNGVEISICDIARKFSEEHVGGTFIAKNGKVDFLP